MTRFLRFCRGTRSKAWDGYLFFVTRKGVAMKCQLCHQNTTGLIVLRVYTSEGIQVRGECYQAIERHRHQPYSKVMEKLAMAEAGYHINRKRRR